VGVFTYSGDKEKFYIQGYKILLVRPAAVPTLHTNNGDRFNNLNE
jgi:hypothetical protein